MRAAMLLTCLFLAGCAGGPLPGEQPPPGTGPAAAAAAATAAPPAGSAAPKPSVTGAKPSAPAPPDSIQLMEARVECWAKVEKQRALRDIDRRIAFVEKCIDEATKSAAAR